MQYEKIDQKKSDLNIAISPMRLISIFSIILNIWAVIDQIKSVDSLRSLFVFSRIMLINFWLYVFMLGIGLFCFIITFLSWGEKIENLLNAIHKATSSIGWLNWLLFFIPIVGYGYYRLSGFTFRIIDYINPLWFIGHLALFAAIFLWSTQKVSFSLSILLSLMLYGCFLWIISFFPEINDYPLSLGWSEANRYYYASLYFSPLIYGKWVPLPSLHPTRYLMQSIPFLFHSNHILFHRLWQSFLWVITTFTAGYALSRRLKFDNKWISIGLASWFFLFVFQGPVYYHLMIVVIMILFGFDKDRLWRSLVIVILASIWAGISRVNWFPVAGMLAVALYVLETPQGEKDFWAYWGWPIIAVVVGLLFAFGSQSIYARISGNPVEVFSSSFSSPLYRYRLFPNDAFGSGIILMIIYACSPISILLVWKLIASLKAWKILRVMALASILLALLVAGLIVSMKIGGGDNLHNMDAFLTFLAIITTYVMSNQFKQDSVLAKKKSEFYKIPVIILAILIPVNFIVNSIQPYKYYDDISAWDVILQIQTVIDQKTSGDEDVLFIDQRHLLTFGMIEGVDLVPEYEKVFLMEMAMANNEAYLQNFWRDINEHRYELIICETLKSQLKSSSDVFGEENNVWVERVSKPLLDSYTTILEFPSYNISVLAPKD